MDNGNRTKLRIAVLGAGGFLGSSIVRTLVARGHSVVAFWRHPRADIAVLKGVESVVGDLRDVWMLERAFDGCDLVYHFASSTYPSRFFSDPASEYAEAVQPLLVTMETARRRGVSKFVFPSSGGTVYADSDLARTEDSRLDPRSPYAIFKLAAEQLLHHAARQGHFSVDVFRIGNPYGPGQIARPGQGVLPHWIDSLRRDSPIRIFGDGTSERDYIYIDDICKLMTVSCDSLDESGTYNVGTGTPVSLNSLVSLIQEITKRTTAVDYAPARDSDIRSIALCPNRILSKVMPFEFTPIRQGLYNTLQYHKLGENT
jgi:UDP-glucose 4-epimerase